MHHLKYIDHFVIFYLSSLFSYHTPDDDAAPTTNCPKSQAAASQNDATEVGNISSGIPINCTICNIHHEIHIT